MRRPLGRTLVAVFYAALALNAWGQVVLGFGASSTQPRALVALQALVGAAGAAAAWGSWAGRRWAPAAAVAHAVVTAGMLVALDPLLELGPEARGGLRGAAAGTLAVGLALAWYLRRRTRGAAPDPAPADGA